MAPSLFKKIKDFLNPQQQEEQKEHEVFECEPTKLFSDEVPNLVGLLVSFPKGFEIQTQRNIEFLNMLVFGEQSVSFEIVGSYALFKFNLFVVRLMHYVLIRIYRHIFQIAELQIL